MERISVHDMFVNPEATSLEDARWVSQRIVRHIDDVHNDPAYSRKARESVQAGLLLSDSQYKTAEESYKSKELVEVFEFYDLHRKTMSTFATGAREYLIRPRAMPYAFGHPFEQLRNYEIPDHFYPMGDLESVAPLIKELSKTRSEMMNHRARYARKYIARKSAINKADLSKIASKRDGEVIFIEDDNVPLNDVIQPVNQVSMDPGLYNWSQLITQDIEEISGVSEFMRGGGGHIRRTATEASLMQDAANVRTAEKLDRVETFIERQRLGVGVLERKLGVAFRGKRDHTTAQIDANAPSWLERGQQATIAATEVQHPPGLRHEFTHEPGYIPVVKP